jgi:hypothetical protein
MAVAARWTGSATNSGYNVWISTREPDIKVYAVCRSGTPCRVRGPVPIPKPVYFS